MVSVILSISYYQHHQQQERPAVADKPARRLRNVSTVSTVYVRAVGFVSCIGSLPIDSLPMVSYQRPI